MIDVLKALNQWIPQVAGRYLNEDWNPTNLGFGAQCWDVAANWSKYLGLPVISTNNTAANKGRWPGWAGNMVDVFPQTAAIGAAYTLVGPGERMLPGDIVVWGDSNPYYPSTHVAVGVTDLGAIKLCVSQNSSASRADNPYPQWTTGPTILQHLPTKGCIGFIRPRAGVLAAASLATTSQEDDMAYSPEEMKVFAHEGALRALKQDIANESGGHSSVLGVTGVFDKAVGEIKALVRENGVKADVPWYGFDGQQPTEGRRTTSAATAAGYSDAVAAGVAKELALLRALVNELAVKQGVTIDYAAIATAVVDEEARRLSAAKDS